ncbi:MAG: enoyl-CoA hydratase/isomerase family protein [Deltaproteobacteria bacterium]|nr:enoyl-CoA hydratase/isomerase family protein [Deltaproteobacteria bacterium]
MDRPKYEFIRLAEADGGVVTLTLNRPDKKNALSIALRDEVSDALAGLAGMDSVKVVVVTGSGTVFSAGFDLKEFARVTEPEFAKQLWDSSDRFHRALLEFPLPTIAAVNGPALAGGFDLAVLCDLRIAAETATFAHPEITFGDVVYSPLHDLVGGALARELCLTGRSVGAAEALALRLVSAVVPAEELEAQTRRWAAQIVRTPRDILKRTKAKIIRRAAIGFRTTLDL